MEQTFVKKNQIYFYEKEDETIYTNRKKSLNNYFSAHVKSCTRSYARTPLTVKLFSVEQHCFIKRQIIG